MSDIWTPDLHNKQVADLVMEREAARAEIKKIQHRIAVTKFDIHKVQRRILALQQAISNIRSKDFLIVSLSEYVNLLAEVTHAQVMEIKGNRFLEDDNVILKAQKDKIQRLTIEIDKLQSGALILEFKKREQK